MAIRKIKPTTPGQRGMTVSAYDEITCRITDGIQFFFQGEAVGGASGSPIFNKHGELVGVLWGGWKMGSTLGLACQARYLKEMYEEEVGL